MVRRYQIRLMRSVNARCVSIGLVLALSNCSESGGEPDAMLDMHHPGTGIDSHHPQFHNSYGNMKFIIIVINPTLGLHRPSPREPEIYYTIARSAILALLAFGASQVLARFSCQAHWEESVWNLWLLLHSKIIMARSSIL